MIHFLLRNLQKIWLMIPVVLASTVIPGVQAPVQETTVTVETPAPPVETPPAQQPQPVQPPPQQPAPVPQEAPAPESAQQTQGNGRVLFVGDSRTIDMFADSDQEIRGADASGITVYALHGAACNYLVSVIDSVGRQSFDTLVTWMGANDGGSFAAYETLYNSLLAEGKKIIVCTAGPTQDETLASYDHPRYENSNMIALNQQMVAWANANGVRVIDLYGYCAANITIDPADGIHYLPRPTSAIWSVILSHL
ncbi:MAG: SGNH/GDSL hydrolase family protein [Lachnospiraceae bacterium]|nr:SGNH/GDSL hydrolase family protein [Lachnospiraceae bacterium]